MNKAKVICIGEALVDRLGPPGGTIDIDQSFEDCLGGAPANLACGLAKLGLKVEFIGCLGNDSTGKKFKELFLSRGVNITGLQVNDKVPTRIVLVKRDLSGERSFAGFFGDKGKGFSDQYLHFKELESICSDLLDDTSWLLLGTLLLASKISKETILRLIKNAKYKGIKVAIDLNWRPIFWDESLSPDSLPSKEIIVFIRSFLKNASLIKLAKEEALYFFDSEDPYEISHFYSHKPDVVITDGAQPIQWYLDGFKGLTKVLVPPKVIDTTGAGDSFLAGLVFQMCSKKTESKDHLSYQKIVRFGAACGALTCTGAGAIEPQPTVAEVEKFLLSI